MINTLTNIRLGHGGGALIDNVYVPATSGSMDNSVNVQYQSGYSMPPKGDRSRILHADGTVTHTGSVSFDLTYSSLAVVKNLCERGESFPVSLLDGEYGMNMLNCYVTSLSLSGSPSGILSASLSFMSDSPSNGITNSNVYNKRDAFTNELVPYWYSGNSYVRDWTFTFNQSVTPKFHNKCIYRSEKYGILAASPNYLFIGETDYSLDFTTFCPLITDNVHIYTSTFTIKGRTTGTGYIMGGSNDLGMYRYNIASHSEDRNNNITLTITQKGEY